MRWVGCSADKGQGWGGRAKVQVRGWGWNCAIVTRMLGHVGSAEET